MTFLLCFGMYEGKLQKQHLTPINLPDETTSFDVISTKHFVKK